MIRYIIASTLLAMAVQAAGEEDCPAWEQWDDSLKIPRCVAVSCNSKNACSADETCTESKKSCFKSPCKQFTCSVKNSDGTKGEEWCPKGEEWDSMKKPAGCVAVSCASANACSDSEDCTAEDRSCIRSPCPQFSCAAKTEDEDDDACVKRTAGCAPADYTACACYSGPGDGIGRQQCEAFTDATGDKVCAPAWTDAGECLPCIDFDQDGCIDLSNCVWSGKDAKCVMKGMSDATAPDTDGNGNSCGGSSNGNDNGDGNEGGCGEHPVGWSGPGEGSNWCNTCTCREGGMLMCTLKLCIGDDPKPKKEFARAKQYSLCTKKETGDKCASSSDGKVTHTCAPVSLSTVFGSGSSVLTRANAAIAQAQDGEGNPNGPKEGEISCTCSPGCTNGKYCDPGIGSSDCQCKCQSDKPEDCEPGGKDHADTEFKAVGGGDRRDRRQFNRNPATKDGEGDGKDEEKTPEDAADCCTPDPCGMDEACMTTSLAGVCECWGAKNPGESIDTTGGLKNTATGLGGGLGLGGGSRLTGGASVSSGLLGGSLARGTNLWNDKVSSLQCQRVPSQASKGIWLSRCKKVYEDSCDPSDCSSCTFVDPEEDAAIIRAQKYCASQCSAGKKLEEARVALTAARGDDGKVQSNIMKGAGDVNTFLGSMGFASTRDGKKQASDLVAKFVGAQNLEISALRDALAACGVAQAEDGGDEGKPNGPKEGEISCTCSPGCTNGKYCDPGIGSSDCQCKCQSDKPEDCEPGGKDHADTEFKAVGGGDRLRRAFDKAALSKWAKESTCTEDETTELSTALAGSELRLQSASALASSLTDTDEGPGEGTGEAEGASAATASIAVALSVSAMLAAASFVW